MHWNPKQVTINSGILKFNGTKSYHSYFSDDLKHDTIFVEIVIEKMLDDAEIGLDSIVTIQSNNCSSQYKSVNHFAKIQNLWQQEKYQGCANLVSRWS